MWLKLYQSFCWHVVEVSLSIYVLFLQVLSIHLVVTSTTRTIFNNKVEEISLKLGVDTPRKIGIKKLKNRWGSLTPSGAINLNVNLLKTPSDVIDYIILHELCHFKVKEHSHHYWDQVYKHMPNYQEKIDWLNINGMNLM